MKKKKKIDAKLKLEKRIYKTFVFITIFLILGIIGVVVFKFIRNILPAKADEKYDYE